MGFILLTRKTKNSVSIIGRFIKLRLPLRINVSNIYTKTAITARVRDRVRIQMPTSLEDIIDRMMSIIKFDKKTGSPIGG